jgi:DNA-binding transcriptional regulator GbsR (MarR family)
MFKAAGYRRIIAVATDVLNCLGESSKGMTVTDLVRATGRNGSLITVALQKLEQQGLVRSTRGKGFSHRSAGADVDHFMITQHGRQAVKHGFEFSVNYLDRR